jgi:hypothetical protein
VVDEEAVAEAARVAAEAAKPEWMRALEGGLEPIARAQRILPTGAFALHSGHVASLVVGRTNDGTSLDAGVRRALQASTKRPRSVGLDNGNALVATMRDELSCTDPECTEGVYLFRELCKLHTVNKHNRDPIMAAVAFIATRPRHATVRLARDRLCDAFLVGETELDRARKTVQQALQSDAVLQRLLANSGNCTTPEDALTYRIGTIPVELLRPEQARLPLRNLCSDVLDHMRRRGDDGGKKADLLGRCVVVFCWEVHHKDQPKFPRMKRDLLDLFGVKPSTFAKNEAIITASLEAREGGMVAFLDGAERARAFSIAAQSRLGRFRR